MSSAIKQKYYENYIQYGFTAINKNDCNFPLCVIYNKVLSVECMEPRFLKQMLKIIVLLYSNKKKDESKTCLDHSKHFNQQNEAGLCAFYIVSLRIAQKNNLIT